MFSLLSIQSLIFKLVLRRYFLYYDDRTILTLDY